MDHHPANQKASPSRHPSCRDAGTAISPLTSLWAVDRAALDRDMDGSEAEEDGAAAALSLPGGAEAAADPVTTFRDVV